MTTARRHAWRPCKRHEKGFLLIALVALLTLGGLYFLVSNLSPEFMRGRQQQRTAAALAEAREALIGYAVQYREQQRATGGTDNAMYGFLPMPDMGTSRLNLGGQPASCNTEGCAMAFINGAFPAATETVVGRFPWRTVGTGPLRDGNGECLWYAVSANFKSLGIDNSLTMNWDTLSQMDVVVANGTTELVPALASAHDRPIAVIFSPGPPLARQDRSASATDNVTECGGNYDVRNYLDPFVATDLRNVAGYVTNYLAGINHASGDTAATIKSLSANGVINRRSDATLFAGNCPPNDTSPCAIVANDTGSPVTSELLFRTLRGSTYFRTDINAMLDRMVTCMRDQFAAPGGSLTLDANSAGLPASPADKTAGRIPNNTCYDDTQNPLGYFSHYRDQVFVATPNFGTWDNSVTVDGVTQTSCSGTLIFANQRGAGQSRTTTERNTLTNYLEGANLAGFINTGTPSFTGPSLFGVVKASRTNQHDIDRCLVAGTWTVSAGCHSAEQDIVRCIPSGPSLNVVAPSVAATAGAVQLASYVASARTLTLGSAGINSNAGAVAEQLFACAWDPEIHAADGGFRSYFRFRIRQVGEGFTFAVIDGDRNGSNVCGAARQHLGYSGDNGITPYIQAPKLAIEFDTVRNGGFLDSSTSLSGGRNDPCYLSSCGAAQNLSSNAHIGVMYWGYGATDATIPVIYPKQDDNVHGFPRPPDSTARPTPRNSYYAGTPYPSPPPDPALNIAPLDRMGATSPSNEAPAKREFHARLEVTRSFSAPADAKDGSTGLQVKLWIEPHTAANITAMTYNSGSPPTLTVTTSTTHNLNTGDYVVIKDAVPTGYNGEYPITRIDANNFTATLPSGKTNPGRYISSITWADNSVGTDQATVTSPGHGLNTGDTITISGAVPTEYNVSNQTVTWITADSYSFGLELSYEPGDMPPAIAAARALTPRAIALANTARPMSELDASFKPIVTDNAIVYDEQLASPADCTITPCNAGSSCGSDKKCYQPSLRNLRLGFTVGERVTSSVSTARGQLIEIKDRATTWLP